MMSSNNNYNTLLTSIFESIKSVKTQYVDSGMVSPAIFNMFVQDDPTENNKYVEWMCRQYVADKSVGGHIGDAIKLFHRNVERSKITNKDIYNYNSVAEVDKANDAASETMTRKEKKVKAQKGLIFIAENDFAVAHRLDTHDAAYQYGLAMGNVWCITYRNSNHYDDYTINDGKTFYVVDIKKDGIIKLKARPPSSLSWVQRERSRNVELQYMVDAGDRFCVEVNPGDAMYSTGTGRVWSDNNNTIVWYDKDGGDYDNIEPDDFGEALFGEEDTFAGSDYSQWYEDFNNAAWPYMSLSICGAIEEWAYDEDNFVYMMDPDVFRNLVAGINTTDFDNLPENWWSSPHGQLYQGVSTFLFEGPMQEYPRLGEDKFDDDVYISGSDIHEALVDATDGMVVKEPLSYSGDKSEDMEKRREQLARRDIPGQQIMAFPERRKKIVGIVSNIQYNDSIGGRVNQTNGGSTHNSCKGSNVMKVRKIIQEAVDVSLYKRVLDLLADYTEFAPATGISQLLDQALEQGKSVIPHNKKAIEILEWIFMGACEPDRPKALHAGPPSAGVCQKLMNMRFCDLPVICRPRYRDGKQLIVACWSRGGIISDRIKDLMAWEGKTGGSWTDLDGNTVTLV
jgi:hypothetical protein